jgi:hypothetical protein
VQSTKSEECEDVEGRIGDSGKQRYRADRISARDPFSPGVRKEPAILFTHLMEGIGLARDRKDGRMFITDLSGSVYTANLDGSDQGTLLYRQGNLTGIAYAEIPGQPIPQPLKP